MGLDVTYVAENHENLRHIIIFLRVASVAPGVDIELEIPSSFSSSESGESFIVKYGARTSAPQPLPGRVFPGKKQVGMQNGYFEIKLSTLPSPDFPLPDDSPLLDASQLMSSSPSSFICASCSLPVIHSSDIVDYKDLPSEHWQELVEAWMCHADQKLHDHVAKHGKTGFYPLPGQALVGGSYILFEDASLSKPNLYITEEVKVCMTLIASALFLFLDGQEDRHWKFTNECCYRFWDNVTFGKSGTLIGPDY